MVMVMIDLGIIEGLLAVVSACPKWSYKSNAVRKDMVASVMLLPRVHPIFSAG